MSTTLPAPLTADAFFAHPPTEEPAELVRGEVRVMSFASGRHGTVAGNVFMLLRMHVHGRGLGVCFPDGTGFKLPIPGDTEDSVRSPDAAFISATRCPDAGAAEGWVPCAPDLAVEVLSPSDTAAVLQEKLADYLAAGTLIIWVVNPRRWTVEVHRPGEPVQRLGDGDTLDGAPVLPDFHCAVGDLFAGIARPAPRPAPPAEPR